MKLHELRPAEGSRRKPKRVGRGLGSGLGKTAGRGTKGQGARTSVNIPANFEGGQTKLAMRIPKLRGFHNKWKKVYAVVNLTRLNRFDAGSEITPERLLEVGAIKDVAAGIKVLGAGHITRKVTVRAHRFSADARTKIEAAGGTVIVIPVPPPIRAKTKRIHGQPRASAVARAAKNAQAAEEPAQPSGKKQKTAARAAEKTERAEKAARTETTEQGEKTARAEKPAKAPKAQKAARGSEDQPAES
jgi:large subunit ribosomal protein L15